MRKRKIMIFMRASQIVYLELIVSLFHGALLMGMIDKNPIIPNVIVIRNYTNRDLQVFVIPKGKHQEWKKKCGTSVNLSPRYNMVPDIELQKIEKKYIVRSKKTVRTYFSKFLQHDYTPDYAIISNQSYAEWDKMRQAFCNEQERKIFIQDPIGFGLLACISKKGEGFFVLKSKIIHKEEYKTVTSDVTIRHLSTKKQLTDRIEYPKTFDSINFTLELRDGNLDNPFNPLGNSDFFGTIVE